MAETGKDILLAKSLLEQDEVVAIPTETVYGLAGNAFSEKAILKIFEAKKRPLSDPLIVHVANVERMKDLVLDFPPLARKLMDAFSPGPLTILLPKSEKIPKLVTNGSAFVAIRIPKHPLTIQLLESLSFPLVAPSANPFGALSPTLPQHVEDGLGKNIPYILDGGPCEVGLESTIIQIINQNEIRILRQGGISEETLRLFAQLAIGRENSKDEVVPGSMFSHYAPKKALWMEDLEGLLKKYTPSQVSYLAFHKENKLIPMANQKVLSREANLEEAAQNLFSFLHELDQNATLSIFAEKVPDAGLGKAINDRLKRASAKRMER